MSLQVPNEMVGLVIGKNGSTVRQLQEQSGAIIHIPKESAPGMSFREVTITGHCSQVGQCQKLIVDRVTNRTASVSSLPGWYFTTKWGPRIMTELLGKKREE